MINIITNCRALYLDTISYLLYELVVINQKPNSYQIGFIIGKIISFTLFLGIIIGGILLIKKLIQKINKKKRP